MKVPYLKKQAISDISSTVLTRYKEMVSGPVAPPIPVEDIIERYYGLQIDYIDFEKRHGLKDVYGATYVQKKLIAVSDDLLSDKSDGRICFTFAHEAGHWELHRKFVDVAGRTESGMDAVFCRERDARAPIEWQADYFASCLLMPADDVKDAFISAFGTDCLKVYNEYRSYPTTPFHFDISADNWQFIAGAVIRAGGYSNVSKQAMIIRLQELGLILNLTKARMTWKRSRYLA